jgi:hypothetical protein
MEREEKFVLICLVLGLVVILGSVPIRAKCKADAYQRVTGKHISWWDAMLLDPQVRDEPK